MELDYDIRYRSGEPMHEQVHLDLSVTGTWSQMTCLVDEIRQAFTEILETTEHILLDRAQNL